MLRITMIVMTMILTRLTVKSSGFGAKNGMTGQSGLYSKNALPSVSNKLGYALVP